MNRVCILGGRVIDPANRLDRARDLVVSDGRIACLCRPGDPRAAARPGDRVIAASGLWVLPGLVDPHVHLRQPGGTRAESVASGTLAAAAGGFTSLVCMPNTRPPLDSAATVRRLTGVIRREARVRVLVAAALSVGLEGRQASDLDGLLAAGAFCFSDDGRGTGRAAVLAHALERSAALGPPVLVHAEDHRLSAGGVMRAGPVARRLGLPGIPAASEWRRVERDLRLLARHGGRLHLQHLSSRGSLFAVRRARRRGLPVSCEVTLHHLLLSDLDLEASCGPAGPDPDFKMNPPLGRPAERDALREALADGTIDCLASDHAPHLSSAKARGFTRAPFGVIGLETGLGLAMVLVDRGLIGLSRAVELLTIGPARVLGIEAGSLGLGQPADICLVDPRRPWRVEPGRLRSRSRNTPFAGWTLPARVVATLVGGKLVHRSGLRQEVVP